MQAVSDYLFSVNWADVFGFDTSPIEVFVRGSVVYLGLVFLFRVVLRRETGGFGVTDLLVVVLIADAVQKSMAGDYKSVPDGLMLGAALIFWSFALDWLTYNWPAFQRFIHPPPLPIIKDGHLLRANLRKELLTEDDVMAEIRQQRLEELAQVQRAFVEPDGRISIIAREESQHPAAQRSGVS